MSNSSERGFTLIELMVVSVILPIVALSFFMAWEQVREEALRAEAVTTWQTEAGAAFEALRVDHLDHRPQVTDAGVIFDDGDDGIVWALADGELSRTAGESYEVFCSDVTVFEAVREGGVLRIDIEQAAEFADVERSVHHTTGFGDAYGGGR